MDKIREVHDADETWEDMEKKAWKGGFIDFQMEMPQLRKTGA